MEPFNSRRYFHCRRHVVTLFGCDMPQFGEGGLFSFIILLLFLLPSQRNVLEEILQLLTFIKGLFRLFSR